ncbi:hypothetical protein [Paraburkholderia sp. SIMBA_054]|uniref:hypothetical protein n=1 Tax=Paraburkholderia sp. SIMBA_054 TaxID=3085795 RepID=UPI003978DF07
MTTSKVLLTEPKNQARIQEIRTNTDVEVQVRVRSPRIRRWVVREFNFVTSQLYLSVNSREGRALNKKRRLKELLDELSYCVDMLEADTEYYEGAINEEVFPGISFGLRLVSPAASVIYKCLVRADIACTKLYMSEFNGNLDRDKREKLLEPVTLALLGIKQFSAGFVPKTAAEMAEELEIG